ncbi:hypothetical protein ACOMHN_043553 [Nucella lapillus]
MDDFSGLEYDQESVSEEDVVSKTNNLLSQFSLPTQVTGIRDITASLFVVLYESLFSDRLPGIVRQPVTREDEISNCQMVIDVLSADVIKDNLSHIRGLEIVEGKVQAINNLLDIFTFLYEYVIKQIESDVPTDTDDDVKSFERLEAAVEEDSETFLPAQESLLNGQRGSGKDQAGSQRTDADGALKSAGEGNGMTPMGAARLKSAAVTAPSPIPPNMSTSLMGQQTLDFTADLIREGHLLDRQFEKERSQAAVKSAWDKPPADDQPSGLFDFIGVRPAPATAAAATSNLKTGAPFAPSSRRPQDGSHHYCFTHHLVHHFRRLSSVSSSSVLGLMSVLGAVAPVTSSAVMREPSFADVAARVSPPSRQDYLDLGTQRNMSATEPVPKEHRRSRSPGRMRATVGAIPVHSPDSLSKAYQQRGPVVKGLSSSYEDLHQMVQQTAALTRAAIDTSPLRRHRDRAAQLNITDLSQERYKVPVSEGMSLAKELNRVGMTYPGPHPFSSGEPNEDEYHSQLRKTATPYSEITYQDTGSKAQTQSSRKTMTTAYQIPPNTDYIRPTAKEVLKPPSRQQSDRQVPATRLKLKQSVRRTERRGEGESPEREVEEVRLQAERPEGEDRMVVRSRPADSKEVKDRRARLSNRLQEMGKPGLANAQRRLETEDRFFQYKQDFVKKLYEEDFGDVVDEVQGLVIKDRHIKKAMEEEYKNLMLLAAGSAPKKPKPASKPKGYLLPKTRKPKAVRSSQSLQSCASSPGELKLRDRPLALGDDEDLMPVLLEDFPNLHLSDHTWHELWRRGIHQIDSLTQAYEENKRRKSRAQLQLEEAARKHEVLATIVKKQLDHSQRMQHIKDQKQQQVMLNNKMHEKRTQSARARRYYNDYQVRARSKMMKRRSREELIFKNLFKDGLTIQRERIQEVRRYAKDQRDKQAQKRQDEIDSLENFYRDQFELLVEKLVKDKDDMNTREKAHQKVLDHMKRDLRGKMEKEIKDIQAQMFRDDDDVYFRQLEADRLRQELQHATYQTRV